MFWNGTHVDGGSALGMAVTGLLFLALLAGLTLLMLQDRPGNSLGPPTGPESHPASRPSPEQVLAERFARGEIDATEYRYRLAILARRRPPHPTHPAGRGSPR